MTDVSPSPLPLGPEVFADPHRLGRELRRETPVRRIVTPRGLDAWVVTRYEDCRAALSDPRLRKDAALRTESLGAQLDASSPYLHAAVRAIDANMLNSDPPDHTRLRRLVGKAFTQGGVARLRPRIEEIGAGLLDAMEEAARTSPDGTVDLLTAFAQPLPIRVICEILGVDRADGGRLLEWAHVILSAAPGQEVVAAASETVAYFGDLVERKRAEPGDDLLSAMVQAAEDGDRLSRDELIAMAMLLVTAGHDTTVNLIANGTLALLSAPEQLAALHAGPELVPDAVEELLRFDGPVHLATYRFATEAFDLAGATVERGDLVLVSLLAGNRDGERFAEPDRLDVTRKAAGHLAFGHGIHHCLGAPLARLEARIAFGQLIARFPGMTLAAAPEDLVWRQSTLIHGMESLPVRLS